MLRIEYFLRSLRCFLFACFAVKNNYLQRNRSFLALTLVQYAWSLPERLPKKKTPRSSGVFPLPRIAGSIIFISKSNAGNTKYSEPDI